MDTEDPATLKKILSEAYGIRGVVEKQRTLFLAGQTRIHIDRVEGLGDFMELEVVLNKETIEEGEQIARDLMKTLGISPLDLIDRAYIDLLEKTG